MNGNCLQSRFAVLREVGRSTLLRTVYTFTHQPDGQVADVQFLADTESSRT